MSNTQCAPLMTDGQDRADISDDVDDPYPADRAAFSALLDGTNISQNTFLATDFLNNLNELIMLVGLVADMPEMLDEVREWQPLSYTDHFAHSGFPYPELAIAGWHRAEPLRRVALDQLVGAVARQIDPMVDRLEACLKQEDSAAFADICEETRQRLLGVHDWGAGVIQGTEGLSVGEVEAVLAGAET